MGAALSRDGMTSLSAMIDQADRCLYEAKSAGRNRVCQRTGSLSSGVPQP
jgi:PleD family two-component response regulator